MKIFIKLLMLPFLWIEDGKTPKKVTKRLLVFYGIACLIFVPLSVYLFNLI